MSGPLFSVPSRRVVYIVLMRGVTSFQGCMEHTVITVLTYIRTYIL